MSDWTGTSRSNYFKIKSEFEDVFKAFCKKYELTICKETKHGQPTGALMIHADNTDKGGWPMFDFDANKELDIVRILQEWITTDSVVVLLSVGHDGIKYVTGNAVSFTSYRRVEQIDLNDIFKKTADILDIAEGNISTADY